MQNEKRPFDLAYLSKPGTLAKDKAFLVRTQLFPALVRCLEPLHVTHFNNDTAAAGLFAQQLAFLPAVNRGWGPTEDDIQKLAENLVACFQVLFEGYAQEGFPAPAQAAFEALKHYHFST